ncbi:hypothetical protein ADL15_21385 [Actinoplanes awajinensis subsp. mycoplanecinus]|uniref:Uncharacterized protein n=1 Tax=Actinoplanes awajinensis subsp. mycoplanecinus TaxID=135947 RepID=A0A101JRQ3_9ACTN|nr:hypothetical protein ADL15_21385 [Actinoplanes awajinensis subsp. mycoplanecinus]
MWGLWAIWTAISPPDTLPAPLAMAAIGFAAVAAGTTLTGADPDLDRTAALPWPTRRALHLALAALVILGLLLSVAGTAHGYGEPVALVRNCAGALGLISLGAATLGGARSWFYLVPFITIPPFLPISRTTGDGVLGQILGWPVQAAESTAAGTTAAVLLALGAAGYIRRGSRSATSARAAA